MSTLLIAAGALLVFLVSISVDGSAYCALVYSLALLISGSQIRNISSLPTALSLAFLFQNFLAAPLLRLLTSGVPVEYMVREPELSFTLVLFCSIILLITARFVQTVTRAPLLQAIQRTDGFPRTNDETPQYFRAAVIFGVFGTIAIIGNYVLGARVAADAVNGSFGFFYKYMPLSCVSIGLFLLARTGTHRRAAGIAGLAMTGVVTLAAIFLNVKKLLVDAFVSYILASVISTKRISIRSALLASIILLIVATYGANLINIMRFDVLSIPQTDRAGYIIDRLPDYLVRAISEDTPVDRQDALSAWYLNYLGRNPWVQRLSGVQLLRLVAERTTSGRSCMIDPLAFGMAQALPAGIGGPKHLYSYGDLATWEMGLRSYQVSGYPYFPIIHNALYCYGVTGGLMATFLYTLAALLVITISSKLLGPTYGWMFLFILTYNSFIEGDIGKYIEICLRSVPELTAFLYFALTTTRTRSRSLVTNDQYGS